MIGVVLNAVNTKGGYGNYYYYYYTYYGADGTRQEKAFTAQKRRARYKGMSMCEFIDLHNHILPGIDDGAPDLEVSLKMIEAALEVGVTTLVCTSHIMPPHYDNSTGNLVALTKKSGGCS